MTSAEVIGKLDSRLKRLAELLRHGSDGVGGDWACEEAALVIENELHVLTTEAQAKADNENPYVESEAPEQIVLNAAYHDSGLRQWLIEQLAIMDSAELQYQSRTAKLSLAREAAYEIAGLANPNVDQVEQVIRKYFLRG